jgi:hypothetical protein
MKSTRPSAARLAAASFAVVGALVTVVLVGCGSAAPSSADHPASDTSSTAVATASSGTSSVTPRAGGSRTSQERTSMRVRLTVDGAAATARLYDTATALDFAALLPVTLRVHDLGGREKAGTLPRALTGGDGQATYRAGQLGYWSPSHDLAVYYHEDGFRIPPPGIVMIGEVESGLDAISNAGDGATIRITSLD